MKITTLLTALMRITDLSLAQKLLHMKLKILSFIPAIICGNFFQLLAQKIDPNIYTTNGPVYSTVQKGDTLYIGGSFNQMGYGVKQIARYLPDSSKPDFSFIELAGDGKLSAVEPDGNGGYYLCGLIYQYNGKQLQKPAAVIHILPDNSLDPVFKPTYLYSGFFEYPALCIKKVGNRLYLGGNFYSVNGVNHKNLVAMNATTGTLISWYPDEPDGSISKIEATDSLIFLLGDFKMTGEYPTEKFAVLKASNGKYTRYYAHYPKFDNTNDNDNINSFKIKYDKLYLGGSFQSIGYRAGYLAKTSASSGKADISFPETNGLVNAILPDSQGGYYIGGNFSLVNNIKRFSLAHILADGSVDRNFNFYLDGYISCLETDGVNLYFGGAFTRVNNTTRRFAAAVSLDENKLTAWNPYPDDIVSAITYSNGILYMGGSFKKVKGKNRSYAAAVTSLNKLTNWDPQPDGVVLKILAAPSGVSLFIAGAFSLVKGAYHPSIAKVNNSDGRVSAWNPQVYGSVYNMALKGNRLFIGGDFYYINGIERRYFAELNTDSDNPADFDLAVDGPVYALALQGNKLYVGGSFTQLQNTNRNFCARINLINDSVDNWSPEPGKNISVIAAGPSNVVIGGNFQTINELRRNHLASINLRTNKITGFDPSVNSFFVTSIDAFAFFGKELIAGGSLVYADSINNYYTGFIFLDTLTGTVTRYFDYLPDYNTSSIRALSVSANKLYVGGAFSSLNSRDGNSIERSNLVSYNLNNNKLTGKIYNPNGGVFTLYTDNSQRIIAAGLFSLTDYISRSSIAGLSLSTGRPIAWKAFVNGEIRTLAIKDSSLFIGGSFYGVWNKDFTKLTERQNLAAINTKTGAVTSWNANTDGDINSLAVADSTLYIGGYFSTIKGSSRYNAAAMGTGGIGTLKNWAPEPNFFVRAVLPVGNKVYLGGHFNAVKGIPRNYLASVNNSNGAPTAWNPNPDYFVRVLMANSTTLYVGGQFSNISHRQRQSLAAFTLATNQLTSFNPKLKSISSYAGAPQLNGFVLYGKSLYIGSDGFATLDSIKGVSRFILGAADTSTGKATSFNPVPNSTIYHLNIVGNRLFVGGGYTSFATSPSASYFSVFNLNSLQDNDAPASSETSPAFSAKLPGIKTSNKLEAVLIPNPVKDRATLNISGNSSRVNISVTDLSGKLLWQSLNQNIPHVQIPAQTFSAGIYFITVRDGSQTSVIKFVKIATR